MKRRRWSEGSLRRNSSIGSPILDPSWRNTASFDRELRSRCRRPLLRLCGGSAVSRDRAPTIRDRAEAWLALHPRATIAELAAYLGVSVIDALAVMRGDKPKETP